MGCFNRTGFYSHLPITYGDDIVMFMCADTSKIYNGKDSCPISVIGTGYVPLSLPFFGKYDDYGGIEQVVNDANHQFFTNKVGITFEEFSKLMHDMDGVTISYLKERIEHFTKHPEEEEDYEWGLYNKKQCEKLLNIFESIIGFKVEKPKNHHLESEELTRIYEQMYERELKFHDEISIILTMEHRSVYNKMVEVGREHFFDYHYGGDEKVTPEDAFDYTAQIINQVGEHADEDYEGDNPFHDGLEFMSRKEMNKRIGIKLCLHDTVYVDDIDYALYSGMRGDISQLKENACDFAYFLSTFECANVTFGVSPYHSQTVSYEQLIPIYEEMLRILKENVRQEEEE